MIVILEFLGRSPRVSRSEKTSILKRMSKTNINIVIIAGARNRKGRLMPLKLKFDKMFSNFIGISIIKMYVFGKSSLGTEFK